MIRAIFYIALLAATLGKGMAFAQELTPRDYWPMPVDTNAVVLGHQRNTGVTTRSGGDFEMYSLSYL